MKNQLGFIPDNISAISNSSLYVQLNNAQESVELNHEQSDDQVGSKKIKRAKINEGEEKQQEKIQIGSLDETNKKLLMEIKQFNEIAPSGQFKLKQSQSQSENKLNQSPIFGLAQTVQAKIEHQSQHPSFLSESKKIIEFMNKKQSPSQINPISFEDKIQVLHNQTNQELQEVQNQQHNFQEQQSNKFQLPKIDKIQNQSIQHHPQLQQSNEPLSMSLSPSHHKHEVSSPLSFEQPLQQFTTPRKQSIHRQVESQHKTQPNNEINYRRDIAVVESHLEYKSSRGDTPIHMISSNNQHYNFTPQNERNQDQKLVKAITEHLNILDDLKYQQKDMNTPIKAGNRYNKVAKPNVQDIYEMQTKKQINALDQLDDPRKINIMEHRIESNTQCLIHQTQQLISYCYLQIVAEDRKQTKRDILTLEMENRREKISLRNGSYSKKFNFHNSIAKNNKDFQFKKKFKIATTKAETYHSMKQKINQQKQTQIQNNKTLQMLTNYFQLIKHKKISNSYDKSIEYVYNTDVAQFQTIRKGLVKMDSKTSEAFLTKKKEYEFDKTKRTVQINTNTELSYYQLLKYKIDMSRDMILQTEVYNLGKIKKIKDQNSVLKKELQFINQEIQAVQSAIYGNNRPAKSNSATKIKFRTFNIGNTRASFDKSPIKNQESRDRWKNIGNIIRPASASYSPMKSKKSISLSRFKLKEGQQSKQITPIKRQCDIRFSDYQSPLKALEKDDIQCSKKYKKRKVFVSPNNQYGLVEVKKSLKQIQEEIPTFGKQQNLTQKINVSRSSSRKQVKSRNLVQHPTQIKTEQNLRTVQNEDDKSKGNGHRNPNKIKTTSSQCISASQKLNIEDKK